MEKLIIRHKLNPKIEIAAYSGHFATRHSHNSHYIDITPIKHLHMSAREAAIELARSIMLKDIDTIVCLDGSEVLGAFLARHLAKKEILALNSDKNIAVITPEYDTNGQMLFRDNMLSMIKNREVLLLVSTVNSGKTAARALECVGYYGGRVQGISAVFSSIDQIESIPIYSLFSAEDIPNYITSSTKGCPMCKSGQKISGISNGYGFSKL